MNKPAELVHAGAVMPQLPALPENHGDAAQVLSMIQSGVERGMSVDQMSQMFDLYQRVKKSQAEESFNRDFVAFQSECPAAPKSTHTSYVTKEGRKVEYDYADLETLMGIVRPVLFARGFSLTFTSEMQGPVLVRRCTVRHRDGHSVHADAPVSTTSSNPGMSEQQKYAGAETSASRRALVAVLGLPLTDQQSEEEAKAAQPLTEEQSAILTALLAEVCPTDAERAKFLKFMRVATTADITAGRYNEALLALENKRKGARP